MKHEQSLKEINRCKAKEAKEVRVRTALRDQKHRNKSSIGQKTTNWITQRGSMPCRNKGTMKSRSNRMAQDPSGIVHSLPNKNIRLSILVQSRALSNLMKVWDPARMRTRHQGWRSHGRSLIESNQIKLLSRLDWVRSLDRLLTQAATAAEALIAAINKPKKRWSDSLVESLTETNLFSFSTHVWVTKISRVDLAPQNSMW